MAVYEIEKDRVIIHKHGFDTLKEYAIVCGVLALVVYFLMSEIPQAYRVGISAVLLLGSPLAYYLLRQIRIIFDNGEQLVYVRYPLLGQRILIRFADISHVGFVTQSSNFTGFNAHSGFYQIARKNDPMGKGLKVLTNVPLQSNEAVDFNLYALPLIESYVSDNKPYEVLLPENNQLREYVQEVEPGVYVFRHFRWVANLLWLGLLLMGLWITSTYIRDGFHEWVEGAVVLVTVIMPAFMLFLSTKYLTIDTNNGTVTTQCIGGLLKKVRQLSAFSGFHYERNTHNGIYTGTDLNMNFRSETQLSITSFYRTTQLDKAVRELNLVLIQAGGR